MTRAVQTHRDAQCLLLKGIPKEALMTLLPGFLAGKEASAETPAQKQGL